MRALFTFVGGSGHLLPCVPTARALVERGHEVAFGCQPAMMGAVAAAGFTAFATGGSTVADAGLRRPLMPVDRVHEEQVIRDGFAGRIASERTPGLIKLAGDWAADVIVHDEVDFAAVVAAEVVAVPHVCVVVLAAGGLIRPDVVAEPFDALRAHNGLLPDPGLASLHRHLTVVPAPPRFRSPSDPLPSTARHVQPAVLDRPTPDPPSAPLSRLLDWLDAHAARPTIYVTLGTVFHQESGDLFPRVLAGISELEANVVVRLLAYRPREALRA